MTIKDYHEQQFFNALNDIFVGAKIEGESGYINLMAIKSRYYTQGVFPQLKKDIAAARKLATADSKAMFDLMEMGMKMKDNTVEDKTDEQFDKSKMEMGEAKITGDRATVNVKEKKSGEAVDFVLKKEGGEWKVAMDMATMMSMGAEKMKEKGMNDEQMGELNEKMEEFKNMSADSLKMIMDKGMKALDSLKKAMEKQ